MKLIDFLFSFDRKPGRYLIVKTVDLSCQVKFKPAADFRG